MIIVYTNFLQKSMFKNDFFIYTVIEGLVTKLGQVYYVSDYLKLNLLATNSIKVTFAFYWDSHFYIICCK